MVIRALERWRQKDDELQATLNFIEGSGGRDRESARESGRQ